jgi:acyl-CoA synthetase (AMP-forming)/AMP-acid ligase II
MALLQSATDMTARQIEGDFETVADVLRAAAVANAEVEAYVEPETESSARRHLTFAEWDRAADGVAGLFARSCASCSRAPSTTWSAMQPPPVWEP